MCGFCCPRSGFEPRAASPTEFFQRSTGYFFRSLSLKFSSGPGRKILVLRCLKKKEKPTIKDAYIYIYLYLYSIKLFFVGERRILQGSRLHPASAVEKSETVFCGMSTRSLNEAGDHMKVQDPQSSSFEFYHFKSQLEKGNL
ncbi:hypothetical protein E2320_021984 [Naja naja]|nr:hypothetical protein E2320_021984 [Naja naja]